MSTESHDRETLTAIEPLRAAGFALHWLHPRQKRPIGSRWQDAPVASLDELRRTHQPGANLGVRLGEPSLTSGGYLHVFDLDIRLPDLADEAWAAFGKLFPGVAIMQHPCVASGSGGESRHLYFVTDKPFFGHKLAVSEGKHRRETTDPETGEVKEVWSYDWEIELFGTGKQVAMPPSIHPDTGEPYVWEREFDFALLDLGLGPHIPAAVIEALGIAETSTYAFESREPLDFKPGQLDAELALIPVERLDDYHDWITLGQALHHQFGGSTVGYDLWVEQSKRSAKFSLNNPREMLRKWRGFGKNRRQPVTMATIRTWAAEARAAALVDAFDDDLPDRDNFDDLLGDGGDDLPDRDNFDDPFSDAAEPEKPAAGNTDWISLLDLNEEGAIKPTLHNVELILKNDPRLVGVPQLNQFTQETVQRLPPGQKPNRRKRAVKQTRQLSGPVWNVRDTLNGELWNDDRDFAVRSIIEAPKSQGGYSIKVTDRDLRAATVLAAHDNAFHPVREYLDSVRWDGQARVERLFIDYLGAPDDAYTRDTARLMMLGAVTRIFEPGHKFDFAVILEGLQGKRKSTFIQVLGRSWFAELDGDFHDPKQMIELMQGAWIMEIPELSGFQRADVRALKAFISRQRDRARLAYARRAGEFPRQCVFVGSTNDREYLKDDTGGRRFWPIECSVSEIDTDRLERNIDLLWAEAVALYRQMRREQPHGALPLYLTDDEARVTAARLQESRRVESPDDALAGRIAAWLDRPVNNGGFDEEDGQPPRPRNYTCLLQIWCEALDGDIRSYSHANALSLGRAMRLVPDWVTDGSQFNFPTPYGKQRVYERLGSLGRNTPS